MPYKRTSLDVHLTLGDECEGFSREVCINDELYLFMVISKWARSYFYELFMSHMSPCSAKSSDLNVLRSLCERWGWGGPVLPRPHSILYR